MQLNFGDWAFCLTDVDDPAAFAEIDLYPNLTLTHLQPGRDDFVYIEVVSEAGQLVLHRTDMNATASIEVSHLPQGLYWLVGRTAEGRMYRSKFVKQ